MEPSVGRPSLLRRLRASALDSARDPPSDRDPLIVLARVFVLDAQAQRLRGCCSGEGAIARGRGGGGVTRPGAATRAANSSERKALQSQLTDNQYLTSTGGIR